MDPAMLIFPVGLLWALILMVTRPHKSKGGLSAPGPRFRPPPRKMVKTEEERWMLRLMNITRGNRGAIERGVLAKRKKFPRATRAELLELLYEDYVRDRNRN